MCRHRAGLLGAAPSPSTGRSPQPSQQGLLWRKLHELLRRARLCRRAVLQRRLIRHVGLTTDENGRAFLWEARLFHARHAGVLPRSLTRHAGSLKALGKSTTSIRWLCESVAARPSGMQLCLRFTRSSISATGILRDSLPSRTTTTSGESLPSRPVMLQLIRPRNPPSMRLWIEHRSSAGKWLAEVPLTGLNFRACGKRSSFLFARRGSWPRQ